MSRSWFYDVAVVTLESVPVVIRLPGEAAHLLESLFGDRLLTAPHIQLRVHAVSRTLRIQAFNSTPEYRHTRAKICRRGSADVAIS